MLNMLGNKLQKTMQKMRSKTSLKEEDILEVLREIRLALLEADVNLLVVKKFIKSIKEKALTEVVLSQLNPGQNVIKIVRDELVNIFGSAVKQIEFNGNPDVVMMVGLQGSGKTTTTAKLINFWKKKKQIKNPLIVAADVYRPAAIEQLKVLSKELNIPVFDKGISAKPQDIVAEAIELAKVKNYDLVIIDTAGRLSIDETLMDELFSIKKISKPKEIIYVVDSLSGQDVVNVASTFNKKLNLTGLVITKMDSDARGGSALSIVSLLQIPILFIGIGEKLSDLDKFYPDRMAERILGMGDVLSLIEKAQDVMDEKTTSKLANRMMTGHFDLNDLLEQITQMKKLGKLGAVLKMIPGAKRISQEQLSSADKKSELYEILISSMTNEEKRNPKLLKNAKRKERVIKGSGRSAQDFNKLLLDFDRMSKQMKNISKQMRNGTFNHNILSKMIK